MSLPSQNNTESVTFYNQMAKTFRAVSEKKKTYNESVDQLITKYFQERFREGDCHSIIDIGTGDGVRIHQLAKRLSYSTLTLVEPSESMLAHTRQLQWDERTSVVQSDLSGLDANNTKADVVFCLWNVLGHLTRYSDRVNAFKKLSQLMTRNGVVIFDVNNRFNIRNYGVWNVIKNIIDTIYCYLRKVPSSHLYQASFLNHEGNIIYTPVHIFTVNELRSHLKEAGLKIERLCFIDYGTGKETKTQWCGQIFVVASHQSIDSAVATITEY